VAIDMEKKRPISKKKQYTCIEAIKKGNICVLRQRVLVLRPKGSNIRLLRQKEAIYVCGGKKSNIRLSRQRLLRQKEAIYVY